MLKLYDVSPWVVLAGITLWLILKVTGVINTPLIVEYAPIFGAVYVAGVMVNKLHTVAKDVLEMKNDVKNIDKRVYHVEGGLLLVTKELSHFNKRLYHFERK